MSASRHYEIRLFDRTLVEFTLEDGLLAPKVKIDCFDESARALMPCGLSATPEGIWRWLEIRSIPTNRRNASRICRELGFSLGTSMAQRATVDDGVFRLE